MDIDNAKQLIRRLGGEDEASKVSKDLAYGEAQVVRSIPLVDVGEPSRIPFDFRIGKVMRSGAVMVSHTNIKRENIPNEYYGKCIGDILGTNHNYLTSAVFKFLAERADVVRGKKGFRDILEDLLSSDEPVGRQGGVEIVLFLGNTLIGKNGVEGVVAIEWYTSISSNFVTWKLAPLDIILTKKMAVAVG